MFVRSKILPARTWISCSVLIPKNFIPQALIEHICDVLGFAFSSNFECPIWNAIQTRCFALPKRWNACTTSWFSRGRKTEGSKLLQVIRHVCVCVLHALMAISCAFKWFYERLQHSNILQQVIIYRASCVAGPFLLRNFPQEFTKKLLMTIFSRRSRLIKKLPLLLSLQLQLPFLLLLWRLKSQMLIAARYAYRYMIFACCMAEQLSAFWAVSAAR